MPNWAFNQLTVSGPDPDATAFRDIVASCADNDESLIGRLVAADPRCYRTVDMDGDTVQVFATYERDGFDGIGWCYDNWGCKWPDRGLDFRADLRATYAEFTTPWCAPVRAFTTISRRYPTLTFSLYTEYEGDVGTTCFVVEAGRAVQRS